MEGLPSSIIAVKGLSHLFIATSVQLSGIVHLQNDGITVPHLAPTVVAGERPSRASAQACFCAVLRPHLDRVTADLRAQARQASALAAPSSRASAQDAAALGSQLRRTGRPFRARELGGARPSRTKLPRHRRRAPKPHRAPVHAHELSGRAPKLPRHRGRAPMLHSCAALAFNPLRGRSRARTRRARPLIARALAPRRVCAPQAAPAPLRASALASRSRGRSDEALGSRWCRAGQLSLKLKQSRVETPWTMVDSTCHCSAEEAGSCPCTPPVLLRRRSARASAAENSLHPE